MARINWTVERDHNHVAVEVEEYDGWFGTEGWVTTDTDYLPIVEPINPEFNNDTFHSGDNADTGCKVLDKMLEDWDDALNGR